jgi:Family of unknown function (DUF5681)
MSDDDVGYGKPPKHSRFKPGNNANPKGRPKRKPTAIAEIIDDVLDGPAEYRERGRTKKASRRELTVKTHIKRALAGDLSSIETTRGLTSKLDPAALGTANGAALQEAQPRRCIATRKRVVYFSRSLILSRPARAQASSNLPPGAPAALGGGLAFRGRRPPALEQESFERVLSVRH